MGIFHWLKMRHYLGSEISTLQTKTQGSHDPVSVDQITGSLATGDRRPQNTNKPAV